VYSEYTGFARKVRIQLELRDGSMQRRIEYCMKNAGRNPDRYPDQ
jgi:hypothetical protein